MVVTLPLLFATRALAEDVSVSSNVKGAAILLNGVDTGLRTPATVSGVAPGSVLIAVEGGCARGEVLIDVRPGVTTRASVIAEEQQGTLTIQPKPITAEVELDGRPYPGAVGTPVALACGRHDLRASLDGYVPAIVTIDLGMGQDLVIPLAMQKLGLATVDLSVQPRNAEILLDGKPVGTDAVSLPSVYQGPHTIAAELDGYQTAKKQILVLEGESYAFHFELERSSKKSRNSRVIQIGGTPAATAAAGAAPAVEEDAVADVADPGEADDDAAKEAAAKEAAARKEQAARDAAEAQARKDQEARDAEAREAEARKEQSAREAAEAKARKEQAAREAAEEQARRDEEARREEEARRDDEARAQAKAEAEEKARRDDEARAEKARQEQAAREAADAERKRDAARRRANAEGSIGKTVGGVGLLAVGGAAGVATVVTYDRTQQAYIAYSARVDAAEDDRLQQKKADEYYDQTVVPRRNLMYAAGAGTALFLAGGVTVLLLDEGGPTLAPLPGGGMLGWTVPF